jgi:hypothetical protein
MDIGGLQKLLLMLGGRVAEGFRTLVGDTFKRVMAGDQSLIEVINANAVSEAPMQQAYRASLAQDPVASTLEELCNVNKKRERDDVEWDLQIVERKFKMEKEKYEMEISIEKNKISIEKEKISNEKEQISNDKERMQITIQMAAEAMLALNAVKSYKYIDERTKVQFEDLIKNSIFKPAATKVITTTSTTIRNDGEGNNSVQPATVTTTTIMVNNLTGSISVSSKAKDMGIRLTDKEAMQIGKEMAKQYREKYNVEPGEHRQAVNGFMAWVKSYTERDSGMLEAIINDVVSRRGDTESAVVKHRKRVAQK